MTKSLYTKHCSVFTFLVGSYYSKYTSFKQTKMLYCHIAVPGTHQLDDLPVLTDEPQEQARYSHQLWTN